MKGCVVRTPLPLAVLLAQATLADTCADIADPWLELAVAVQTGDDERFACSIEQVDVNGYDPTDIWENTPLHIAAIYDQPAMARRLIDAGADLNRQNAAGKSPLRVAIDEHANDTAAMLIFSSADLEVPDEAGRTMLFWSVARDNVSIATLLVEQGANREQTFNVNGRTETLSQYARRRGNREIVSLFTE
jgi:ankyrin repeat protein